MTKVLLSLNNLSKIFTLGTHEIRAVDGVFIDVHHGECLAIVGESGSGKTTLANMILGIYGASSGEIRFKGDILPTKRTLPFTRFLRLIQNARLAHHCAWPLMFTISEKNPTGAR